MQYYYSGNWIYFHFHYMMDIVGVMIQLLLDRLLGIFRNLIEMLFIDEFIRNYDIFKNPQKSVQLRMDHIIVIDDNHYKTKTLETFPES